MLLSPPALSLSLSPVHTLDHIFDVDVEVVQSEKKP